jgi:DNA replication and repair protein RecF
VDGAAFKTASIVYARIKCIALFFDHFKELYSRLSVNENPSILYRCSLGKVSAYASLTDLYDLFLSKFKEIEKQEISRAQTMLGPHRDDIVFLLDDKEIKKYASQGQMRTFLICLKLSQHRFFTEILGEKPLCLLDDVFSELDATRTADIFSILETCGQSIITSAENKVQTNVVALSIESLKNISVK